MSHHTWREGRFMGHLLLNPGMRGKFYKFQTFKGKDCVTFMSFHGLINKKFSTKFSAGTKVTISGQYICKEVSR